VKRLIVYRSGDHWFAHTIQTQRTSQGEVKEFSRVSVPQTKAEIEEFARRNGWEVEWEGETISAEQAARRHAGGPHGAP
jgi:hypothetical protein